MARKNKKPYKKSMKPSHSSFTKGPPASDIIKKLSQFQESSENSKQNDRTDENISAKESDFSTNESSYSVESCKELHSEKIKGLRTEILGHINTEIKGLEIRLLKGKNTAIWTASGLILVAALGLLTHYFTVIKPMENHIQKVIDETHAYLDEKVEQISKSIEDFERKIEKATSNKK